MRKVFLGVVLASGAATVVGCNSDLGAPSSGVVQSQVEYNMVIADDRAKFREQDLSYLGSVGPYAVYKITGAKPALIGPYVKAPSNYGYAMACGATHYFSVQKSLASPTASMQLRGGKAGQLVLVDVPQMPQDQGGCTTPKDSFGNPLPDMGTGGGGGSGGGTGSGGTGGSGGGGAGGTGGGDPGAGGGGTGCTSPEGGCGTAGSGGTGGGGSGGTTGGTGGGGSGNTGGGFGDNGPPGSGGSGGGATPGDGDSGDTGVTQIGLTMNPPPPMGSTVLVRRVALTAARQHNGSHVEPNICCKDNVCSLQ